VVEAKNPTPRPIGSIGAGKGKENKLSGILLITNPRKGVRMIFKQTNCQDPQQ
jgi:hypothetical protein